MKEPGPLDMRALHDATHLLNRRLPLICFILPLIGGCAMAALTPARFTAQALLLIGTAEGPAASGSPPLAKMLGEQTLLDAVLRRADPAQGRQGHDISITPTADAQVALLGYTAASASAATGGLAAILNGYKSALLTPPPDAGATLKAALAAVDHEMAAIRTRMAAPDLPEELRAASRRVAALTGRLDQAQQQSKAAKAALAAAKQMLAVQPGSVRGFVETAETGRSDADATLLLGLLVDRDHLLMQYASGSPPVQEISRKIETVRSTMAASSQGRRATVRDVRNPSVDLLNQHLAMARIAEREADGNVDETLRQLTTAKARSEELLAAEPQLLALQRERESLERAYRQLGPALPASRLLDIGVLQSPYLSAIDRRMALVYGVGGLILGTVLMAAALLMQRAAFRRLLPVDHSALRPLAIQAQPPSLIDGFGHPAQAVIQPSALVRHA